MDSIEHWPDMTVWVVIVRVVRVRVVRVRVVRVRVVRAASLGVRIEG